MIPILTYLVAGYIIVRMLELLARIHRDERATSFDVFVALVGLAVIVLAIWSAFAVYEISQEAERTFLP